ILNGLDSLPAKPAGAAITVGNFYAIHRGHQKLIASVRSHAAEAGLVPTVVTFEPHPQKVLHGEAPCLLIAPGEKLKLMEEAGVGQVLVLPFTKAFSRTEPEQFVEDVLMRLNMKALVVGADFRFGRFARGDATMLRSYSAAHGFVFESVRLAESAGRRISSTEIRHALQAGDLRWANRALGRPFGLTGRVVHGSGRGAAKLGYPTANIKPPKGVCVPADGIYAGRLISGKLNRPAAISVGRNAMFGEKARTIEAFALDYKGSLYGKQVRFEFVSRIRDHVAFGGPEALKEAIGLDVARVRRLVR
ncbi:MAG: riboflavin biosynthesis protein RibF, partial [Actinomycetota bacterium]